MNSNRRGRTRFNDRSAREGSSADHAALRRTPTHGPAQSSGPRTPWTDDEDDFMSGSWWLTGAHQWFRWYSAVSNSP